MSNTVIRIEDLGKQYKLGLVGTGTLSHDLNRWWARLRGKEDPFLKVGEVNNRTVIGNSQYVWALKDINLDIKEGEVLGIIGKNGAGKSTLLKILSKVTGPTTGRIKVKGRIGSLLEVGTGFHPELTGRENIFLNGAILGMTKWEIKNKLDEIIDFSGTEKYINTPVKRYSSGMKVRLAFAVAAHLDPEILVIDEVLAVGDSEFQRKCLNKMNEVSRKGRTILFVTHQLAFAENLCTRGILIHNGKIEMHSNIVEVIQTYIGKESSGRKDNNVFGANILGVCVNGTSIKEDIIIRPKSNIEFEIQYEYDTEIQDPHFGITFENEFGQRLIWIQSRLNNGPKDKIRSSGMVQCELKDLPLVKGRYFITVGMGSGKNQIETLEKIGSVFVEEVDYFKTGIFPKSEQGLFLLSANWKLNS